MVKVKKNISLNKITEFNNKIDSFIYKINIDNKKYINWLNLLNILNQYLDNNYIV